MSGRHKSLQEFMAEENENFGGYRINGHEVSREDYVATYNGDYDEDYIAKIFGQGLTRQRGNY